MHAPRDDPRGHSAHIGEPHTQRFIARVTDLIDHPLDVQRTCLIGQPAAAP